MAMQVNPVLCAACGMCVDACSVGAISLTDQQVVIDEILCTRCGACIDACPNGAISMLSVAVRNVLLATLPPPEPEWLPVLAPPRSLQERAAPARKLVPIAGAALAFLGREVAPRLVNILTDAVAVAVDRMLAQPKTAAMNPTTTASRSSTFLNRGKRRQARYRGRKNGIRNLKGRR